VIHVEKGWDEVRIVEEMRAAASDWLGVIAGVEWGREMDVNEAEWEREAISFPNLEAELGGVAEERVECTKRG
jgi:hypothetical protein